MNAIRIASSVLRDSGSAVTEIGAQLGAEPTALLIFFCADTFDLPALGAALRRRFPEPTQIIGCTTAGEIGLAGYQKESLVAVAFPSSDFEASTALIPELSAFDMGVCQRRVEAALLAAIDRKQASGFPASFAFMLIDGMSMREEAVGRAVQLMLGDIPVIGGSAGDSLRFRQTFVFQNAEPVANAAVLAIVNTRTPFRPFKTQHFERVDERMVVTGARPAERVVTEINGHPAALEYARLVGIPTDSLTPLAFAAYPVMVRVGGAEYVRSIQKANPDHSLSFFCAIDEGIVLARARGLDAIDDLRRTLDGITAEIGEPQVVLACDCILRNLEFQQRNLLDEVSAELRARKVIGFSTYGELHMGIHVNQTITGLAFGQPRPMPPDAPDEA
jgi:hypothetical protein